MNANKKICSVLRACVLLVVLCLVMGCVDRGSHAYVDTLNDISYSYHYRNLDSVSAYAGRALSQAVAVGYADGKAEALNNLVFVSIARMDYARADSLLGEVLRSTDNHIELFVGNVQQMRLCQRRSDSKNFYLYRQQAMTCAERIDEDEAILSQRQQRRLVYARSEYSVVLSTYLYYMGQRSKSSSAIAGIDPAGPIVKDTAQLLAYYYNVGSGGVLSAPSRKELMQSEFDYLMRCYLLSRQYRYAFWEANSLQAISEHLQARSDRRNLISDNLQEFDFLNVDGMPDSLLAGNLAQRALGLFEQYGDVYQIAGAWRTLSEAYRAIGDYQSALVCLENALSKDTVVNAAPDLVASVREQLSIVYSAMNNKPQSDYNRNIYLDLQERTRQDRFLEARAEQLDDSLRQLDMMIVAVVALIVAVLAALVYFGYWLSHRNGDRQSVEKLCQPLEAWKQLRDRKYADAEENIEEEEEACLVETRKLERLRERNIEQRAKVWLASTVSPLIGRMVHEVKALERNDDGHCARGQRFAYISQLADSIDVCNRLLTRWIQLRQGDFQLHIESFNLGELFDTLRQNTGVFRLAGVTLDVAETDAMVKADRTLTLFMLNTIVGNARRYTPSGGYVSVDATVDDSFVEVSVADTGCGMTEVQARNVFSRRVLVDDGSATKEGGHGFGLLNCKGIMEKYRKLSALFNVCEIGVDSVLGKGSRFYFRLPKGLARFVVALLLVTGSADGMLCSARGMHAQDEAVEGNYKALRAKAGEFADSAYFSNVNGSYERTVAYADSCLRCLNAAYASKYASRSRKPHLMRLGGDYPSKAAELYWLRDSVEMDYSVILDVRNETAVAALALHRWSLYSYNNAVYTQLFRMRSADNTLTSYVSNMQRAESNRNVAIIMLVVLLFAIFPAYYLLYYRRRMNFRLYVDRMNEVNAVLASVDMCSAEKLAAIGRVWGAGDAGGSHAGGNVPHSAEQAMLSSLAADIMNSLSSDVLKAEKLQRRCEDAHDECRRLSLDCDRMYISNNVLDNCLSALKHETMYYPSRLRQLVADGDTPENVSSLGEIARYYQLLYTAMISQASDILRGAGALASPKFAMRYMFSLLKRKNSGKQLQVTRRHVADGYVKIDVQIDNPQLVAAVGDSPSVLFSPETPDTDFLVCCQIMRDIGEYTGRRGCGISARMSGKGQLVVEIRAVDV